VLKLRHVFLLGVLLYPLAASAEMSVNIGIDLPAYPNLALIPGYPVYYAPQLDANFFFYDGMYWVYQDDEWYTSSWYNGPWWYVSEEEVPLFLLRIPVRYYRQPPEFFIGWRNDAPPRWGEHWGREWEQHRRGWDRWDRRAIPPPAPLPDYQRQYSRDRYPEQVRQQPQLQQQHYRFNPDEPQTRQYDRSVPSVQQANPQPGRIPDERGTRQDIQRQQNIQDVSRPQVQWPTSASPQSRQAPDERGARQDIQRQQNTQDVSRPQVQWPTSASPQSRQAPDERGARQDIQRQQNTQDMPRPQVQRQPPPKQEQPQNLMQPAVQHEHKQEERQQGQDAPHQTKQGQDRDRNN